MIDTKRLVYNGQNRNIRNNTESLLDPSNEFGLEINAEKAEFTDHISLPECGTQS